MKLPIFYNEVIYGQVTRKAVSEGDRVKCKRCGKEFTITSENVKGKGASEADVICPVNLGYDATKNRDIICGYRCSAYYYSKKVKA